MLIYAASAITRKEGGNQIAGKESPEHPKEEGEWPSVHGKEKERLQ